MNKVQQIFELANNLTGSYKNGILEEQRELVEIMTSNLLGAGKKPVISIRSPFSKLLKTQIISSCRDDRDRLRINDSDCVITDINQLPEKRKALTKESIQLLLEAILDELKGEA